MTTPSTTRTTTTTAAKPRPKSVVWLATLAAAIALPVVLWVLVDPVGGHSLVAKTGDADVTVTLASVVFGAAVSTVMGLGVASFLRRFAKGRTVWMILATVGTLMSLIVGPMSGSTATTVLVLVAMHLLVGGATLAGGLALLGKRDVRDA
ncbi:DUF6069 family protein [Phytomonospora sp. NPDC050363]|uniref:DUF6069 family protein n=1 Tax=Phytomonospora sp. NPDC050363 TaxID=3155642 RepID=UPI0033BFC5C4